MSILLKILLVIGILVIIVLILAFFIKKEYAIERNITINKPKKQVFDYIKYIKNQENYNKWVMTDPKLRKTYTGTDGSVGFVLAWDSDIKNVGKGEQEIKGIREGERIDLELRFLKPFEGNGNANMTAASVTENQTALKWKMEGKNKYPFNLMNLFIDKMLGNDLQESLNNLKVVLEKN